MILLKRQNAGAERPALFGPTWKNLYAMVGSG